MYRDNERKCCKAMSMDSAVVTDCKTDQGCCGEEGSQYCCEDGSDDDGFTSEELGYIIGFSLFGALIVIGVSILLVWVFRKLCRGVKDRSQHQKMLKGVLRGKATTLDELFSTSTDAYPSQPGAIVHETTEIQCHADLCSVEHHGLRENRSSQYYQPPRSVQPRSRGRADESHRSAEGASYSQNADDWQRYYDRAERGISQSAASTEEVDLELSHAGTPAYRSDQLSSYPGHPDSRHRYGETGVSRRSDQQTTRTPPRDTGYQHPHSHSQSHPYDRPFSDPPPAYSAVVNGK
ncbi:hypothetical protein BaRGS_00032244 [Batillaria attramentaria]|uniref:Uncharacterized protein n=1 Tax=Batillaria attramentaria TaxID=370345 RepID=A0ABD0JNE5_9CAEN